MRRTLQTIIIMVAMIINTEVSADVANNNRLIDSATQYLANEGAYWFEMKNVAGEWEKMILVFGYAENKASCDFLLSYAQKTSPARMFKCQLVK